MFFFSEFSCTNLIFFFFLMAYSWCSFGGKNVYVITDEMKNVKKKEFKVDKMDVAKDDI